MLIVRIGARCGVPSRAGAGALKDIWKLDELLLGILPAACESRGSATTLPKPLQTSLSRGWADDR